MEIYTDTTPFAFTSDMTAFGFGMPMGGQSCSAVITDTRRASIPATGLSAWGIDGVVVRDRKGLAVKGHVALAAYVPGFPAWSPPIC